MDDLINRAEVLEILSEIEADVEDGDGFRYDYWKKRVKTMASAERRGMWINDKGLYRCSACKELWSDWYAITVPIDEMYERMKYCPNCGAKMITDKDDTQ